MQTNRWTKLLIEYTAICLMNLHKPAVSIIYAYVIEEKVSQKIGDRCKDYISYWEGAYWSFEYQHSIQLSIFDNKKK